MLKRHVTRQLNLLVDGRLGRDDALKAMAHLAECESCTAKWDALRRGREALQTSGSGIDMRSAQKLLNRERIAILAQAEPRRHVKAAAGMRPRFLKGLLVAVPAATVMFTVLYLLGEPREIPLNTLMPENAVFTPTTSSLSVDGYTDSNSHVSSACPSWMGPDMTPLDVVVREDHGIRVSQTDVLLGENRLTVTERRGRLPGEVDDLLSKVDAERPVYLLGEAGTDIVFESADTVVTVSCDCASDVLIDFTGNFSEEAPPGLINRISEGIGVVADAVTGD